MQAVFTQIPAGCSLDDNLRTELLRKIAAYLEGLGAPHNGNFVLPDLKYNNVKYAVDFTVTGINGQVFQIQLNKIA